MTGAASYANWQAMEQGLPGSWAYEAQLYSDARLVSQLSAGCGPYQLLNTLRHRVGTLAPAFVLRVAVHLPDGPLPSFGKTDVSTFTGLSIADEIASLTSLLLGARLAAGGVTRRFYPDRDPRGEPASDSSPPVAIAPPTPGAAVLPWVRDEKEVRADLLSTYPRILPADSVALVRSARAYRNAIWLAEADPQLSWLLFVSALEVAAVHYSGGETSPEDVFRDAKPELAAMLDAIGPEVVGSVAPHLSQLFKSTARFLRLVLDFMPPPPERRPPDGFRFRPWDRATYKKALSKTYELRSAALHAGIPFPLPMCDPPYGVGAGWDAPCETIPGLASHVGGTTWVRQDMPFGLHLFEYLTRSTLLKWWAHLGTSATTTDPQLSEERSRTGGDDGNR